MKHGLKLYSVVMFAPEGLRLRHKAMLTGTIPYPGACLHSFGKYLFWMSIMFLVLCKVLGIQSWIRGIAFLKNFIVQWETDIYKIKSDRNVLIISWEHPGVAVFPVWIWQERSNKNSKMNLYLNFILKYKNKFHIRSIW